MSFKLLRPREQSSLQSTLTLPHRGGRSPFQHAVGSRGPCARKKNRLRLYTMSVRWPPKPTGGFGDSMFRGCGWNMDRLVCWCRFFKILRTRKQKHIYVCLYDRE
ncbi:hypothetical protein Y032_0116g627 [Ancylostoma ceylanicum]|uniref:Uncharacterized protein n=1 Tax=Ancylostoma ceylanicum TaxID=53326 RepID=A0A016TBR8_9BILA|nr:hypothetical protein Y032_0116g627 [Ancylostoma ceylanicum]